MHQKSAIISDSLFRGKALVSRWTYGVVLWVGVFRVLTITITTWVLKPFSVVSTHKYSNHNSTEILTTQITTRKYSQLRVVSSCWWKYSARKDSRLSVFRLLFPKIPKKIKFRLWITSFGRFRCISSFLFRKTVSRLKLRTKIPGNWWNLSNFSLSRYSLLTFTTQLLQCWVLTTQITTQPQLWVLTNTQITTQMRYSKHT